MERITTTQKREIASELSQLLVKYINQTEHVNKIVRTMDKCQKEQRLCCMNCDKTNDCGLHRAWQSGMHKIHIIESDICLFMRGEARFFMRVLEARSVEARPLFDILVKQEMDCFGYITTETKEYLQEVGYNGSFIK